MRSINQFSSLQASLITDSPYSYEYYHPPSFSLGPRVLIRIGVAKQSTEYLKVLHKVQVPHSRVRGELPPPPLRSIRTDTHLSTTAIRLSAAASNLLYHIQCETVIHLTEFRPCLNQFSDTNIYRRTSLSNNTPCGLRHYFRSLSGCKAIRQ